MCGCGPLLSAAPKKSLLSGVASQRFAAKGPCGPDNGATGWRFPARFPRHAHCLAADGLLATDGTFFPIPQPDPIRIMLLFRHRLLQSLLAEEKIRDRLVEILLSWRHPGFSLFQANPLPPEDHQTRERLKSDFLSTSHSHAGVKTLQTDRSSHSLLRKAKMEL